MRIAPDDPEQEETRYKPQLRAYGEYISGHINLPEYRPTYVKMARALRVVTQIGGSWRTSDRVQTLLELGEVLKSLYQLEMEAERINDTLIREHIFDRLEVISSKRRSIAEEIRWEIAESKNSVTVKDDEGDTNATT